MLFPTIDFALFFVLVYIVAWGTRAMPVVRKWTLIGASYYFYAYWDWRFAILLAECSILNFVLGLLLDGAKKESTRKGIVATGVVFNLSILGFFKYFDFFTASANDLLLRFGVEPSLPVLELMLPVGISFFTFQGVSYVIDVYRKEIDASESLGDVFLYISFFPQLVAGPIVRASCFMPQLLTPPDPQKIQAARSFFLIALGLFKKTVIANYLAEFVAPVYNEPLAFSSAEAWFATYGYAVQLYCDFSAYSDIAIGLAGLLGYHFPENFNQPYKAISLQDFWRRWHISLSSWLKDYLYRPLGGSRRGEWATRRNLFLVMFLAGLWHGAAWTFVVFGIMHGAWIVVERDLFRKLGQEITEQPWFKFVGGVITFHFICFSLVFFAADSMEGAIEHLVSLSQLTLGFELLNPFTFTLIMIGLIGNWIPKDTVKNVWQEFALRPAYLQALILGILFVLLGALGPEGIAPFIYYQF